MASFEAVSQEKVLFERENAIFAILVVTRLNNVQGYLERFSCLKKTGGNQWKGRLAKFTS